MNQSGRKALRTHSDGEEFVTLQVDIGTSETKLETAVNGMNAACQYSEVLPRGLKRYLLKKSKNGVDIFKKSVLWFSHCTTWCPPRHHINKRGLLS